MGNCDLCPMHTIPSLLLVLGLGCLTQASAQGRGIALTAPDSMPWVQRDTLIDLLVRAHVRQNRSTAGVQGYRVQVFSGSGNDARQQANDIRRELLLAYPDLPIHLVYQPPNFKVRVGDCRTEIEATRLKRILAFHYPQGFVVRDMIQLPKLSIEEEREDGPEKETVIEGEDSR